MNSTDAIWLIGDIQGCCDPLQTLLDHPEITNDPQARFWFAGDLVNRGPQSLGALRTVKGLGQRAVSVLGNHDLNLLAVYAGIRKQDKSDTLDDILNAPDVTELMDWLRHRPLAHYEQGHLLVHAGVPAAWTVKKTLNLAAEVQDALRSKNWQSHLEKMFGNEPRIWDDGLTGADRRRYIVNALTRMRMCKKSGALNFSFKGSPEERDDLTAWFDAPKRAIASDTVVFGHWSTLGLHQTPQAIGLDTGCVWGRTLTAMRLQDRKLLQISCADMRKPDSKTES
jgi:bis(5'-nucleosyl)-tetraphosphatase (symmetrical)